MKDKSFSIIALIGSKKRIDLQNKREVIGGEENVRVKCQLELDWIQGSL